MIDIIADAFLFLTYEQFLVPVIILGYIWFDRDIFYHATCLILITMIFNLALKWTFQIPLSPHLGNPGLAFPSGHMQTISTFLVWLAYKIKSLAVRVSIIIILTSIGLSLVHFKYHTAVDVLAAVFFAIIQIAIYYQIVTRAERMSRLIIMFICSILVVYIYVRARVIVTHIWMAYYTLLGFMVSEGIFHRVKISRNMHAKIINTFLCFGAIFAIRQIFAIEAIRQLPLFIFNLHWLMIGFLIPYLSQLTWKK